MSSYEISANASAGHLQDKIVKVIAVRVNGKRKLSFPVSTTGKALRKQESGRDRFKTCLYNKNGFPLPAPRFHEDKFCGDKFTPVKTGGGNDIVVIQYQLFYYAHCKMSFWLNSMIIYDSVVNHPLKLEA